MIKFVPVVKKKISHARPYIVGEDMAHIGVGDEAKKTGSPKEGDVIMRDPDNIYDQWLVTREYFEDNYAPASSVLTDHAIVAAVLTAVVMITIAASAAWVWSW